jgi:hypothetical protein
VSLAEDGSGCVLKLGVRSEDRDVAALLMDLIS